MSKEEIFHELLQSAYNLPEEEIAALLYKKADDGTTITDELDPEAKARILALDKERVQRLSAPPVDKKAIWDEAAKETKGKSYAWWEKQIRTEYGIDPEAKLQGEALIKAAKAASAQRAQDPEAVKMSPDYIQLEQQMQTAIESLKGEYEQRLTEQEKAFQRQQAWAENSKHLRAAFLGLNPVLSTDAEKAERQTNDFVSSKFAEFEFQPTEDGRVLVLKNGQRYNNVHGHAMFLPDLVKQIAGDYFDFSKQPPIGNAGNQNGGAPTPKLRFKDEKDFLEQLDAEKDPAKLKVLGDAWKAQVAEG
jgi:hypothetical protein